MTTLKPPTYTQQLITKVAAGNPTAHTVARWVHYSSEGGLAILRYCMTHDLTGEALAAFFETTGDRSYPNTVQQLKKLVIKEKQEAISSSSSTSKETNQ